MLFLVLVHRLVVRYAGRVQNCRRIVRVIVHHGYRRRFVLIRYRVVIYVPASSAEGGLASAGAAGAIGRLAAVAARSHIRLEHQEIRFGYFKGVEAGLEAVAVAEAIQSREHVVVHRAAEAEKFPFALCTREDVPSKNAIGRGSINVTLLYYREALNVSHCPYDTAASLIVKRSKRRKNSLFIYNADTNINNNITIDGTTLFFIPFSIYCFFLI